MESTERPSFNRELMLERLGGDEELVRDILGVFAEERPKMLGNIREAIASGDSEQLKRAAHTLKGALLNIAAERAAEVARELEKAAGEQVADYQAMVTRLESEVDRLAGEIAAV